MILTVIINLSTKKYTGGDFQIHLNGEQSISQINESGNMFMFKSILPHRVLPILSGERKTLTLFLEGPNFR
jgi:PKHD-type hydroxylase